jgi:branched-chain amino acid transport system ATP-binding protein
MLSVNNLVAGYGSIEALHGVSLAVGAGEIVAVIGSNGAGKSTLMKSLAGLIRPAAGSITLFDQAIEGLPAHRRVSLGLALVPEGRQIFGPLTVLQNLKLGAHARATRDAEIQRDLNLVFELFPRLSERAHQHGATLSGGEQQMLAIGRALMSRPRVLLLDEPSLGLAPQVVDAIFDVLARLNREQGLSLLLVEQNAALALELAHRAYLFEVGRVVLEGSGAELTADARVRDAYLSIAAA